ncbi:branched-chain amino acid ABC transporter permease [Nocardioides sp. zg-579]|uniref:Branched-chain amino acid ABC transporter permease n=1 Tax=Nocardioides marmotae TaxID=2663857 RepID=A0A6I3JD46_9ACTN|nr:branched-chain amino acid ABC transporter permease [Nocardioides marmotae]MCR6032390.1 branched-chain amino acid ABC transporter permease [Gordonia jinghuaiqii]MTB96038.1 branched-chain amino acid ABC transporter permease [Nocardioides marmotae]QKE02639.1 branched-chain amino acid ABC transporter permease [Nocardioides marmotae]
MTALRTWWAGSLLGRHLLLALVGLVVVVVVLESSSDFRNLQLASMAYLGIAAGGLTVLTGLNGQISLGHGALMAIGAYTAALLLDDRDAGTPLPLVVLAAIAVTLLVGVVVGAAAARLHGPYLAGATLALAVAVPGIALYFKEELGGEQGLRVVLPDIPAWVLDLAFFVTGQDLTRSRYVAYLAWLTLIVTFVLLANLSRGRVGRRWRAVRDDEVAAELAGIRLGRARVSAFVVSAAAAGAAGAMMAVTVRLAAPSGFTITLSLTLLTAVVLGGLGSLTGALLGAALLTFLPQVVTDLGVDAGLSDIQAAELSPLVYGLVMVAVILLAPAGLVGTARTALLRRRLRRTGPASDKPGPASDVPGPDAPPAVPTTPTAATTTSTTSKGTTT